MRDWVRPADPLFPARPGKVEPSFFADWHADPYFLSPGPKCLLSLFGAEHGLGGVSGYDAAETTDEDPDEWAQSSV